MDKQKLWRIGKKILIYGGITLGVLIVVGVIFVKTQMTHHTMSGPPAEVKPSGDAVLDSIRRGVEYLKVNQEEDGEFSAGILDPKPAFTAMVVDALAQTPDRYDEKTPFVAKAVKAILSHQQEDGSICSLGFGQYVTSVSVMAIEKMNNPAYRGALDKARVYIKRCQTGMGGMGYSPGKRGDLSNTALALEALNDLGLDKDDEAFKNAINFVTMCQNDNEQNTTQAWAGTDGGFIYRPGNSKAGSFEDDAGQTRFRSYGLMSYAGLVSFLWAGVDKDDRREPQSRRRRPVLLLPHYGEGALGVRRLHHRDRRRCEARLAGRAVEEDHVVAARGRLVGEREQPVDGERFHPRHGI